MRSRASLNLMPVYLGIPASCVFVVHQQFIVYSVSVVMGPFEYIQSPVGKFYRGGVTPESPSGSLCNGPVAKVELPRFPISFIDGDLHGLLYYTHHLFQMYFSVRLLTGTQKILFFLFSAFQYFLALPCNN